MKRPLQLDDIRIFIAVAEQRNVTKAAKQLALGKSTVSERLHALESQLGTPLIDATTRGVTLTDAGRAYYEQCAAPIYDLEQANAHVMAMQHRVSGLIRVSAPPELATSFLGPIIGKFLHEYPAVRIELDLSSRNVDLKAEQVDISLRIGEIQDGTLIARRVCELRRHIYASCDYITLHGLPTGPKDLARHRCIAFPLLGNGVEWRFARGKQRVLVPVQGALSVNSLGFVREAVVSGFGIGMLPDFMAVALEQEGTIVRLCPDWEFDSIAVHAIVPNRHMLAKTRAFMAFVIAHVGAG